MKEENFNLELLEKEYFHLQTEVDSFDAKSLTIKAWSVSLAGLIAGSSAFTENKLVILFAALVSFMFWVVDSSWKTFQYAHYARINHIEKFMRGESDAIANLQIARSWKDSYHTGGKGRLVKIMIWPHVFLPHGAMFLLLLALYMYFK